jgi:hypothetical protein
MDRRLRWTAPCGLQHVPVDSERVTKNAALTRPTPGLARVSPVRISLPQNCMSAGIHQGAHSLVVPITPELGAQHAPIQVRSFFGKDPGES